MIPIHYNYHIQGFLYNSISPKLAEILHDHGFPLGKRKFKLFTFSRIFGDYEIRKNQEKIVFAPPFRLIVSSPMREFIEELAQELMKKELVEIYSNKVSLQSVEVSDLPPISKDKIRIKALSPITVYSTLLRGDGKKKTYYYSPFEKEFSELISENVKKKFKVFYEKDTHGEIHLTPLNVNAKNQSIVSYKNTIIKGWTGTFSLEGDCNLIKLAYDAGIGAKNPEGFGCFEVMGK